MTTPVLLYFDPHPAHEEMAAAVDADLIESEKGGVVDRIRAARQVDVGDRPVIVEGGQPLFQAAWMKKFGNCGPVIHLAADETLMNIFNGLPHYSVVDRAAHFWAHRAVDAVLAVSPRLTSEARALGVSPVKTIFPFTEAWKYDGLGESRPNLGSNRVLAVGKNKPANNFDKLESIAQAMDHDVQFDVVGPNTDTLDSPHVTGHGFVEKDTFIDFFGQSAAFILPAGAQAFPVAVLEALRAGLPPVITDAVGTQSLVRKIHPQLVAGVNIESLAGALDWYLGRPESEQADLSRLSAEMGELFSPDRGRETFRVAYTQAIDGLECS